MGFRVLNLEVAVSRRVDYVAVSRYVGEAVQSCLAVGWEFLEALLRLFVLYRLSPYQTAAGVLL
ncbi:MAG TPA: hypothetical protein VKX49_12475 [Bryobacteraceae bacterium]|nr:hypothetical protein [Bryobacteraceae bacterium]